MQAANAVVAADVESLADVATGTKALAMAGVASLAGVPASANIMAAAGTGPGTARTPRRSIHRTCVRVL